MSVQESDWERSLDCVTQTCYLPLFITVNLFNAYYMPDMALRHERKKVKLISQETDFL